MSEFWHFGTNFVMSRCCYFIFNANSLVCCFFIFDYFFGVNEKEWAFLMLVNAFCLVSFNLMLNQRIEQYSVPVVESVLRNWYL